MLSIEDSTQSEIYKNECQGRRLAEDAHQRTNPCWHHVKDVATDWKQWAKERPSWMLGEMSLTFEKFVNQK
jgi:hypothetical protein